MSKYVRKTNRPWHRTAPGTREKVEEWYAVKLSHGSQKQIAHRLGVSTAYVQEVARRYRARLQIKVP